MGESETDVQKVRRLTRWQRLGLATLFLGGVLIVGTGVFIWSGLYNISARTDHWRITDWIIVQLRDRSIASRAADIEVPDLSDPGLARLGAEHFRFGCASCHGEPGTEQNPVFGNMLPEAPDLSVATDEYSPAELYWIIYHGLKYTGMPAWAGEDRTNEVWPMVALLQHLEQNGPGSYAALTSPIPEEGPACGRCHGDQSSTPVSRLVPRLHGQKFDYLVRALTEYRSNERQSGMMEPLAHDLTDDEVRDLAALYAEMAPLDPAADAGNSAQSEHGETLVLQGKAQSGIPPCASCHGQGNSQYPRLAGQSAEYVYQQLKLFARGGRDVTGYGAIMTVIAQRMSDADMRAASIFYESVTPASPEDGDE